MSKVREIVEKFGGTQKLADMLGRRYSLVSNWISRDNIPSKWYGTLLKLAIKNDITLKLEDLFEIDDILSAQPPERRKQKSN